MICKCTIEVGLHLTGVTAHPDEITQFLGIKPTKTWVVGDVIGKSALRRKQNGWVFALPKEQTPEFEQLVVRLLDALQPYRDCIVAAASQFCLETELACAIYMEEGQTPVGHIQLETLKRITALRAELDLDLIII